MLAVIIVSWNVRDLLRNCLTSLLADISQDSIATRVVVVDSASPDGSAEMVRTEFPMVELMACAENIGYVKGNNLALTTLGFGDFGVANPHPDMSAQGLITDHNRQAAILPSPAPDYVWLLNPDTEIRSGAVKVLHQFMQSHPTCGLCGPKLLNPDGSLQHSAFAFPGLVQLALETIPSLWRFRGTRLDGRCPQKWYEQRVPFRVGHPLGAAMLARATAIAQVGLLDSGFEMYAEEVDWAMRMKRAGWERWCVPAAEVVHFGGASSGQASDRSTRLKWQSRQRYYTKYYSPLARVVASRLIPKAYRSSHA